MENLVLVSLGVISFATEMIDLFMVSSTVIFVVTDFGRFYKIMDFRI